MVFDRFHIKKALNEAVDKVRKKEVHDFEILKKSKYIWLKNEKNLSSDQKLKLETLLNDSSLKTPIAYKLKIEFDNIWTASKHHAEELLETWKNRALKVNLTPLNNFVNTLNKNYRGILNSFKMLENNGISEGINSKIQAAKTKS